MKLHARSEEGAAPSPSAATRVAARLWYEDEGGRRWAPRDDVLLQVPPGFTRFNLRDPCVMLHEVSGVGGDPEATSTFECPWSETLVSALHRPTLLERARQVLRYGRFAASMDLGGAILLAAVACDDCSYVLAHEHGCSWGFRERDRGELGVESCCELCRPATYVGREARH